MKGGRLCSGLQRQAINDISNDSTYYLTYNIDEGRLLTTLAARDRVTVLSIFTPFMPPVISSILFSLKSPASVALIASTSFDIFDMADVTSE